jgi:hypothetical protein
MTAGREERVAWVALNLLGEVVSFQAAKDAAPGSVDASKRRTTDALCGIVPKNTAQNKLEATVGKTLA